MEGPLQQLGHLAPRLVNAALNGLEMLAIGGMDTGEQPAPYSVTEEDRFHRLRHYFDHDPPGRPAAILVPPLMLSADVYDVSEQTSAVTILRSHGVDPWVVDFGAPEREQGGMERTMSDHVLAVERSVGFVAGATESPVHLCGYSQGGMFCYEAAAYRRGEGIASLVTFGSPVDATAADMLGVPADLAARVAGLGVGLLAGRGVPSWATRIGFRLLDPVKSLRQRAEFLAQLHDREQLASRERQRRFLGGEGWVGWSGPALADFVEQFIVENRLASGGFALGDRLVSLADLKLPVLAVIGETDQIAPAPVVRAITQAAPEAEVWEMDVPAGHFGLVVGSYASSRTWPTVAEWARWVSNVGSRPEALSPMVTGADEEQGPRPSRSLSYGIRLAVEIADRAARAAVASTGSSLRSVRSVAEEALTQLPRLTRMEQVRAWTRVSLGSLLDEQAGSDPDAVCFAFEDRAYSRSDAKRRIDNVVRGLLSIGVRQGEPVGVLMSPRPSALVVTAAINRLGAVAVLMRPDGDPALEARLGLASRVVADPEHAGRAVAECGLPVAVLGAGGRDLPLHPGALDLESVDPAAVEVPSWYRPNPGRAADLAFVVFSGEATSLRARRITNHRWALSAFGTASSAAMSAADTVYMTTPLQHPSGLLTAVGGAVAGGARLTFSRDFTPSVFWEEVRRYGATVVSYTWTLLRDVVNAEPDPLEHHHAVRLLVGSGMAPGLWERVERRLAPARVVEFYAPMEGEAVLANVAASKPGAMGRPLPGSAPLEIAAYDPVESRFGLDPAGTVRRCEPGELGMLMVGSHPAEAPGDFPLRGVFRSGDAWRPSGDLFWRDADGDHWLAGPASLVIETADGLVLPKLVDDALGRLPEVDLAVTYGVRLEGGTLAVSAVTLVPGLILTAQALSSALSLLERSASPAVVRVVDEIELTSWHRPRLGKLPSQGVEGPGFAVGDSGRWVKLTPAVRRKFHLVQ